MFSFDFSQCIIWLDREDMGCWTGETYLQLEWPQVSYLHSSFEYIFLLGENLMVFSVCFHLAGCIFVGENLHLESTILFENIEWFLYILFLNDLTSVWRMSISWVNLFILYNFYFSSVFLYDSWGF